MKFILSSVFLSIYVVLSFPIQSVKLHHDAKDAFHLFNSNPMELVSMMKNVDSDQLRVVISMLQGMLTDSENLNSELEEKVNVVSKELAQAVIEAEQQEKTVVQINETRNAAKIRLYESLETVDSKEKNLNLAEQELSDQQPSLLQEQKVLRAVIEKLKDLIITNCSSHSECNSTTFCSDGKCIPCSHCHFNDLAIDGKCPVKCPALCEDASPSFPKCPLCRDQTHCDSLGDTIPLCDDNSGRCTPHPKCKFALEKWFHKWMEVASGFGNDVSKVPVEQIPAAGFVVCQCFHDQFHCLVDQNCMSNKTKGEMAESGTEEAAKMCRDMVKCTPDQCSWVPKYGNINGKSFLNNLNHRFPHWK